MTATQITEAPEPEPGRRSWGDIAFSLSGKVANLAIYDRRGLAGLRRMDPDETDTAAFRRLMADEDLLGSPEIERKWGLILHGIALMTRTTGGDNIVSRSAHDGNMPVGRALFLGGNPQRAQAFYSETRLNRLLKAREDTLRLLLTQLFRRLAPANVSFNWREMAQFIFNDGFDEIRAEESRRRIARDYYQTARRSA